MRNVTVNIDRSCYSAGFKRWDTVKTANSSNTSIVVRIKNEDGHEVIYFRMVPNFKYKLGRIIWFWWLKLRVWLKII